MHSHSLQLHHPPTTTPMSPSHSYTIVHPDSEDDSDICPVCDGDCTCHIQQHHPPPPITPGVPLSMAELSRRYAAAAVAPASPGPSSLNSPSSALPYPPSSPTPTPTPAPDPPKPSLKIKLTVPPGMLAKRRQSDSPSLASSSYTSVPETTSDAAAAGYNSASDPPPKPAPRKRGRPPKHLPHAPSHYKPLNPKSAAPGKQQKRSSSTKARHSIKPRASIVKKPAKKRRALTSDDDHLSSDEDSPLSDHVNMPYIDDDMDSIQFPTFVSASALSSLSSDSSELSDFDSDSSLVKEEENFILADVHDKARLKRELLGGDDPLLLQRKRSFRNSDWVVRPRKKSVGPSDAEMDVDSDATEDDDDDDDEDEDEDGEDETEEDTVMMAVPPPASQEEEEDTDDQRRRYTGFATGWSEDEESSFDADLFFANLSDTDSSAASSDSESARPLQPAFSLGEDGDQSDISCTSDCTEGSFSRRRAALESLPFEVTEAWDGQIVFTNGIHDHQGIIDIEFEADASRFVMERSASPGNEDATDGPARRARRLGFGYGLGLGMGGSDDSDVDMSDGGYEEEDGEGELGEGDTTDEELVGEDDLPNERAMRLFSLPLSVSAINPLSTVSTPNVSPGRRRRQDERSRERRMRRWGGDGLSASDILQGKVLFWDSDEMEFDGADSPPRVSGGGGAGEREGRRGGSVPPGPRKGVFLPSTETRQAVIGESEDKKGDHVPSPHPRFNRGGRGRARLGVGVGAAGAGRFSSVEHLLRRHLLQSLHAGTSSPVGSTHSVLGSSGGGGVVSNSSPSSPAPGSAAASSSHPIAAASDDHSALELLLSSAVAVAAASGSAPEDVVNAAVSVSESVGVVRLGLEAEAEAEPIELGDVLEASFLDDPEPSSSAATKEGHGARPGEGGGGEGTTGAGAASNTSSAADEAGVKNLSRWDLISVGAFRQTREHGHMHTPHSSADFGSVIKSSPLSAVLWQSAAVAAAGGAASSSASSAVSAGGPGGPGAAVGSGGARQASGGAGAMIKGKGSKLAKRRRIMLGGGGSAMSSPLILPLGSSSSPTHTHGHSTSLSSFKHTSSPEHNNKHQHQHQKTRKESRRERKLMKKRSSFGGAPAAPYHPHQHHHHHHHHAHHHHPNAKMRSVSSAQRPAFFGAAGAGGGGGGGVPPLNL